MLTPETETGTGCRILDNLPVAVLRQRRDGIPSTTYEHGFRVGFKGNYAGVCLSLFSYVKHMSHLKYLLQTHLLAVMHVNIFQSKEEKYFIHNHLSFRVMYHKDPETDTARIVGFEVSPGRCVALILIIAPVTQICLHV